MSTEKPKPGSSV